MAAPGDSRHDAMRERTPVSTFRLPEPVSALSTKPSRSRSNAARRLRPALADAAVLESGRDAGEARSATMAGSGKISVIKGRPHLRAQRQ
jgi:hypothetical protein